MHYTASLAGQLFSNIYGENQKLVVDIGGQNVNGSLRNYFEQAGMKYICVDIEKHDSVDIVIKPGDKLPFKDGEIDIVVSTSCFEHDPLFWLTFKEMTRIVKLDGYIYINAPSNGEYHGYPGDNWRFYSDAGQALAYWSSTKMSNEDVFPVKVIETFHILPKGDIWMDFVCIWKRTNEIQTEIKVSKEIYTNIGKLENALNENEIKTIKKCSTR